MHCAMIDLSERRSENMSLPQGEIAARQGDLGDIWKTSLGVLVQERLSGGLRARRQGRRLPARAAEDQYTVGEIW